MSDASRVLHVDNQAFLLFSESQDHVLFVLVPYQSLLPFAALLLFRPALPSLFVEEAPAWLFISGVTGSSLEGSHLPLHSETDPLAPECGGPSQGPRWHVRSLFLRGKEVALSFFSIRP